MDALGRIIANQLQVRLGQSVVIDNRPGGDSLWGLAPWRWQTPMATRYC